MNAIKNVISTMATWLSYGIVIFLVWAFLVWAQDVTDALIYKF